MSTLYKFKAYDKTLLVDSSDLSCSYDSIMELGDAMCVANDKLLWSNLDAREGSWELQETETLDGGVVYSYLWVQISNFPLCGTAAAVLSRTDY